MTPGFSLNLHINTRTSRLSKDSLSSMGEFIIHSNIRDGTLPPPHQGDASVSPVDVQEEGDTAGGLWVSSLGSKEMLPLGYQPSPMTLRWSSGADLLFHYRGASRSTERRHHYPSGLMRLSRSRKRSGNYCRCSFQPGDVTRAERDGGELLQTDALCKGCISAELNVKNGNLSPFIGNAESISEANKDILDALITLAVK